MLKNHILGIRDKCTTWDVHKILRMNENLNIVSMEKWSSIIYLIFRQQVNILGETYKTKWHIFRTLFCVLNFFKEKGIDLNKND